MTIRVATMPDRFPDAHTYMHPARPRFTNLYTNFSRSIDHYVLLHSLTALHIGAIGNAQPSSDHQPRLLPLRFRSRQRLRRCLTDPTYGWPKIPTNSPDSYCILAWLCVRRRAATIQWLHPHALPTHTARSLFTRSRHQVSESALHGTLIAAARLQALSRSPTASQISFK